MRTLVNKAKYKTRAATLLETLLSVGIFSFLVISLFKIYNLGQTQWNVSILRDSLQNNARILMTPLQHDVRSTAFSSITPVPKQITIGANNSIINNVDRDAFCMLGLSDWHNPANFSASGLPNWNEYIIYLASTEQNQGDQFKTTGQGSGRLLRIILKYNTSLNSVPNGAQFPNCTQLVQNVNNDLVQNPNQVAADVQALGKFATNNTTYTPTQVSVSYLGPVFAFTVYRCDPNTGCPAPLFEITYKERLGTSRIEEGSSSTGIETYQINLEIEPGTVQNAPAYND